MLTWEALVRSTKTWPHAAAQPSLWVSTIDEPALDLQAELKVAGRPCAVNGRVVLADSSPGRMRLVFPKTQPPVFCHMYEERWPVMRVARSATGSTLMCDLRWNGKELCLESRLTDEDGRAAVRDLEVMLKGVDGHI